MELTNLDEILQYARKAIPDQPEHADRFWRAAARDLLIAALRVELKAGSARPEVAWEAIVSDAQTLREFLERDPQVWRTHGAYFEHEHLITNIRASAVHYWSEYLASLSEA